MLVVLPEGREVRVREPMKTATHIVWCDGCQENIYPGQKYDATTQPGLLYCAACSTDLKKTK